MFPVPDGDTGTNMLLTMKSACREVTDEHAASVRAVAMLAHGRAHGAARGNSGSFSRRSCAAWRTLSDSRILTGPAFAAALAGESHRVQGRQPARGRHHPDGGRRRQRQQAQLS